jgi:hypothetical protein
MAEKFNFSLDGWDTAFIDVEDFIAALVRAKYPNAAESSTAEVLRISVAAAMRKGRLQSVDSAGVPLEGIPERALNQPFRDLYFEKQAFFAFAREAWLGGEVVDEPPAQDEAQRITVEEIAHMIAIQHADQSISVGHPSDARDGIRRSLELAFQLIGHPPDGIPGVIPQIVELARARVIQLDGPVATDPLEVSDVRASPGLWSLTAEDAQRALASLFPGVRRYTVSDVADIIARRSYPQDITKAREAEHALVERIELAIENGELTENERRRDGAILLNEHSIDEWLIREQIPVLLNPTTQTDIEQNAMEAAGRRRIDDVVGVLAKETGTEAARWESTLVAEIRSGALPLKNPRDLADFLPYAVPKNLRTFYDRVDISDVNKLLDSNLDWRVTYRFPVEPPPALPEELGSRFDGTVTFNATKHALGTRSNPLKAVIDKAKSLAEDPSDTHSVWAALSKLAQENSRPAPLLGYAEAEGVKWDDNGTVKFFTKKNLTDRLRRASTR